MPQEILTVSVSQLNNYIKRVFEANKYLSDICVTGELSNFKLHSSGHIYASLKDEGGVIKLVMFRSAVQRLSFRPDNGMRVVVRGRISVYEAGGVYQLYAESMLPDGVGSLYAAYEKLKAQLAKEGLFEDSLKKPLPPYPATIGIVTAKTGAAVRDMINVTKRRYPLAELRLVPVAVQGVSASGEIAAAIGLLNRHNLCDVIICGRGGGSIEDLWAFNEEIVARAIFDSHIPVVSAVGHETDFTIADFVADLRAPTPSAAAELVCPSKDELLSELAGSKTRLKNGLLRFLEQKQKRLGRVTDSYAFARFPDMLDEKRQLLDDLTQLSERAVTQLVQKRRTDLIKSAAKLDALSPLKTLARGYAIASDAQGRLITSVNDAKAGDCFSLTLRDGAAGCKFI